MVKLNKAIFFDRDGVLIDAPINKDNKPISILKVKDVKFCDGIKKVCKRLSKDYLLIMITNQPDFKRKKNTKKNIVEINKFIKKELKLNDVFVCYSKDDKCFFRKPNPGMLIAAKDKYKLNIKKSFFIGDRWRDIDAGNAFGCKTIFIDRSYNEKLNKKPNFIVKNLKNVLSII